MIAGRWTIEEREKRQSAETENEIKKASRGAGKVKRQRMKVK